MDNGFDLIISFVMSMVGVVHISPIILVLMLFIIIKIIINMEKMNVVTMNQVIEKGVALLEMFGLYSPTMKTLIINIGEKATN